MLTNWNLPHDSDLDESDLDGSDLDDSLHDSIHDSIHESIHKSIHDSIHDSIYDSIYDSIHDSTHDKSSDCVLLLLFDQIGLWPSTIFLKFSNLSSDSGLYLIKYFFSTQASLIFY